MPSYLESLTSLVFALGLTHMCNTHRQAERANSDRGREKRKAPALRILLHDTNDIVKARGQCPLQASSRHETWEVGATQEPR